MPERKEVFLWTVRNTYIKGWIQLQDNGMRRVEIDYEAHPHLKNANFKIGPHILETYTYKGENIESSGEF